MPAGQRRWRPWRPGPGDRWLSAARRVRGSALTPAAARLPGRDRTHHRTRMPNVKTFTGSADIDAMVAQVAPAVLGLLADRVPRTKAAIVAALAGRHAGADVALTLIRLAVTG